MTSPFDADDMMGRGLFASLMGFKKKNRPPEQVNPVRAASTSSGQSRDVASSLVAVERTPNDIFREIVCECEHIERSTTSTPFSEFASCPTSPAHYSPISPQPIGAHPTSGYPSAPFDPLLSPGPNLVDPHYGPVAQQQHVQYDSYGLFAPPPYSPCEMVYPHLNYAQPPPIMITPVEGEQQNSVLLEEVVKMVVSAMRQSSIDETQKESPEEILRRKRQQNNEAAARYRKRQREARDRADDEFEGLSKKNDALKDTVARMEHEIAMLKRAVLEGK